MKIAATPNNRPKSPFHKKADLDAPKPEKVKKETEVKDERLETLIKNKDVKGLQQYKDRQKFKLDSLNQVMKNWICG